MELIGNNSLNRGQVLGSRFQRAMIQHPDPVSNMFYMGVELVLRVLL